MQSDYGIVDTEVTRKNMQQCIIWGGNHKRGKMLWRQGRSMLEFFVRCFLHLSKLVLPI